MNLLPLVFIIIILLAFYSFTDVKKSMYFFIFILYSIPYSWPLAQKLGLYIPLGEVSLSVQELMFVYLLVLYFFYSLNRREIKIRGRALTFAYTCWLIILIVYLIVGFNNNPLSFVLSDLRRLMFYFFIFILFQFAWKKSDAKKIVYTLATSAITFGLINIVIFAFKDTYFLDFILETQWEGQNRIGFSNSLLLLILLPFIINIKDLGFKKKEKTTLYLATLILLLSMVFSRSINLFASVIIVAVLSIVSRLITKNRIESKNIVKVISASLIFSMLSISFLIMKDGETVNNKDTLINDFVTKISIVYKDPSSLNSWKSRMITNQYAKSEYNENIFGYGLGKTFKTFIQNGDLAQSNALFIDNTMYTVLNKVGILGSAVFFILLIIILVQLFINAKSSVEQYKSVQYSLVATYISLLLTMVSTAQIFINPLLIVLISIIILISFLLSKKGIFCDEKNNNGGKSRI
ncbi:hypothetical protein [Siminovitchia terrae]|uniref:hypothetical protein n=1 Tax=Siminovitchia terrae TaxID=1914933 RepID=UPI001BB3AD31|nr:hypothetical protein [Siminovitchia terrae]